jgi:hypothetical protein
MLGNRNSVPGRLVRCSPLSCLVPYAMPLDVTGDFSLTAYLGTQGLIFVIDSNDRDRIDEARTELTRIIQDREMKDALLLVFANKQDLQGGICRPDSAYSEVVVKLTYSIAMRPKEVSDRLQLEKIAKDHVWKVEPSCATTGEGIFEGLVCAPCSSGDQHVPELTHLGMAIQQRQAARRRQMSTQRPFPLYDCMACPSRPPPSAYTPARGSWCFQSHPFQPYTFLMTRLRYVEAVRLRFFSS